MNSIHLEAHFEEYITQKLKELEMSSWKVSNNDNGFDANTALYWNDFVEYQRTINPEKIEKLEKTGQNWENNLRLALIKNLENEGTVKVLRDGFPMAGYQTIICSGGIPDDPRLPAEKERYDANILRVMRQVHYQTSGNKSLDLVFFINGIPVATAEVKTEFTQTVQDAIEEYQTERKPIEPGSKRKNYLLMYKRGAVVHFAISEQEIWMCTDLTPDKPKFLPFNRGNGEHAGNPILKEEEYPTCYFWDAICKKENWLRIFHNFIFEEVNKKEDLTGKLRTTSKQLFPRYHQWDVTTKVIEDVRINGVGQRYLIEHSAGSGKTETISWIAHELIRIRKDNGDKYFSSVIVVTDRIGLDENIKKTIKQLKKTVGLIEMVGGDDTHKTATAKSKQLAQALAEKREIIVVTLQTFPYALDAIANEKSLTGCNFAVLIDEAHNSQEGSLSGKMKQALKLASSDKDEEDSFISDEDVINAYFEMEQSNRVMPSNVSFFAFTATPKAETKTIFGRPGKTLDKNGERLPESFHLYPMRQAIEEEYIIDVLRGYMPYETAYKLKEDIVKDTYVDERKAYATIAKWQKLHPTNVMEKAQFIVEHFMKNVSSMLNNQAKAMVITSSRPSVIRYKYAIDAYLKAHPEYDADKVSENMRFKVPGEPLVAFSEKVSGEKCVMVEDGEILSLEEYGNTNPFAKIKTDFEYTEQNMNNLGLGSVVEEFDKNPARRLLIVADKFQTGFNQPKLCALYIDKRISNDIEIVQTYSRVNRTFPGKDHVYIIDFVNDPESVSRAFKHYDKGSSMETVQNLNIVYDIKKQLDEVGIYTNSEFEEFKQVRYQSIVAITKDEDSTSYRTKMFKVLATPASRWIDEYKSQQQAYISWKDYERKANETKDKTAVKHAQQEISEIEKKLDELIDFRKKLNRYYSAYNYISQVIDLGDANLEVFAGFANMLAHLLKNTPADEIDVRNLVLSDYRINKIKTKDFTGDTDLKPMRAGGKGKASKRESLKKIVSKINEIWGEESPTITGARTINAIVDYVDTDEVTRTQIRNSTNSKEAVIADGRLESIIKLAAISLKKNDFEEFASKILQDSQSWKPLAEMIFDLIEKNERLDIAELTAFVDGEK